MTKEHKKTKKKKTKLNLEGTYCKVLGWYLTLGIAGWKCLNNDLSLSSISLSSASLCDDFILMQFSLPSVSQAAPSSYLTRKARADSQLFQAVSGLTFTVPIWVTYTGQAWPYEVPLGMRWDQHFPKDKRWGQVGEGMSAPEKRGCSYHKRYQVQGRHK